MGLKLQIEIKQSREELEKAVKYAVEASSKERLQMLYWLKTGQPLSPYGHAPRTGKSKVTHSKVKSKNPITEFGGLSQRTP
ncbi:putative transposase (plasmid) [Scytonema sp. HK-05]|uniref:hypothetical protein n=1 Tax=Scytonema sp. HK-05 TaxID=1137095 RepID=UPI00093695AC|nr:hypothetical protein [Scytonema sp. HK-05]OKH56532.1 hypothetical protein NIES2130_24575 [Scytonema sp. HK-05]BAY50170.1 putative transposase [Scytonema sp. HK-05]